jgi:hypothetical protein
MRRPVSYPRLQLVPRGGFQPLRETLPAYRPYTRAILRRYFRMAVDIGRLPSILGRLCFRARVSSYRLHTFEDAVIFVHDIERVFDRIEPPAMEIIAGAVLLDYSMPEVALRLGISVKRAERRYAAALDSLSAALLEVGLLRPVFADGGDPSCDSRRGTAQLASSPQASLLSHRLHPSALSSNPGTESRSAQPGTSASPDPPERCTTAPI